MKCKLIILVLIFGCSAQITSAQIEARYLLGQKSEASKQAPRAYGSYAKGCLAGGEELEINGLTWQVMRLSRGRNWGHPNMIAYLKRISEKVAKETSWNGLYIGDISQPRGGPMISGHASHQLGLDADIWMLPAKKLNLSRLKREKLSSISIRSNDKKLINSNWTNDHMKVIKIAASDQNVDRIFVTAPAKIYMCENASGDKKWLQKIRPFWGHNFHFHVRLKCPIGSKVCKIQKPTVNSLSKGGNGCDKTLIWWITDALKPAKVNPDTAKKKARKHPRHFTMAELPQQCTDVLNSK
jgi:penicillin-insensitive murein endopeptidase